MRLHEHLLRASRALRADPPAPRRRRPLVIPAQDERGPETFLRSERINRVGIVQPNGLLRLEVDTANPGVRDAGTVSGRSGWVAAVVLLASGCTTTYYVRPDHYQLTRERLDDGRPLVIPARDERGHATFLRSERINRVGIVQPNGLLHVEADTAPPATLGAGANLIAFGLVYGYFAQQHLGDDDQGLIQYDAEGTLVFAAITATVGILIVAYAYADTPEADAPSPGVPRTMDSSEDPPH